MVRYEEQIRECKYHGAQAFHRPSGGGSYRCKQCRKERVVAQRRRNKRRLIAEFGGECTECGYSKCVGALHFHHIDPQTKAFGIAAGGYGRSYQSLLIEARKCELLCSNCHAEREEMDRQARDLETYGAAGVERRDGGRIIPIVKKVKAASTKRTVDWPSVNTVLGLVKSQGYTQTGSSIGVSDNAVRKFLKRNGIDPKTLQPMPD